MKMKSLLMAATYAVALGAGTSIGAAKKRKQRQSTTKKAVPPFPAWDAFVDGLRDLWPQVAAKLPAEMQNDPQIQQEIGRLMLEALSARTVDAIGSDGDHPWFLPHIGFAMHVFQPNYDTIRSEERRVGKECVSKCRSRWSPYHTKKNNTK